MRQVMITFTEKQWKTILSVCPTSKPSHCLKWLTSQEINIRRGKRVGWLEKTLKIKHSPEEKIKVSFYLGKKNVDGLIEELRSFLSEKGKFIIDNRKSFSAKLRVFFLIKAEWIRRERALQEGIKPYKEAKQENLFSNEPGKQKEAKQENLFSNEPGKQKEVIQGLTDGIADIRLRLEEVTKERNSEKTKKEEVILLLQSSYEVESKLKEKIKKLEKKNIDLGSSCETYREHYYEEKGKVELLEETISSLESEKSKFLSEIETLTFEIDSYKAGLEKLHQGMEEKKKEKQNHLFSRLKGLLIPSVIILITFFTLSLLLN